MSELSPSLENLHNAPTAHQIYAHDKAGDGIAPASSGNRLHHYLAAVPRASPNVSAAAVYRPGTSRLRGKAVQR